MRGPWRGLLGGAQPIMPHYAWVEGETIVQIYGAGPFDVTYVDPKDDPRNK